MGSRLPTDELQGGGYGDAAVAAALRRLTSLHEGFGGVADVIACGPAAVPPLEALLGTPDPSGVFEPRRRAAQALGALGATDALIDFLGARHDCADPVALAGEEAVIDAAARALAGSRDPRLLSVLTELALWRPLSGVMDALAALHDVRAIPALVEGLFEDHTRRAASEALLHVGAEAVPNLLTVARRPDGAGPETVSSLRTRRAAAGLLAELALSGDTIPAVHELMRDDDPEIAAAACAALLASGDAAQRDAATDRLRTLRDRLRPPLRDRIDERLAARHARTEGGT